MRFCRPVHGIEGVVGLDVLICFPKFKYGTEIVFYVEWGGGCRWFVGRVFFFLLKSKF